MATDVVAGEHADDPLYIPCIKRVQASVGRYGLLYGGDCKMASRETRAFIATQGDFYLCPLPQLQLTENEYSILLWNFMTIHPKLQLCMFFLIQRKKSQMKNFASAQS